MANFKLSTAEKSQLKKWMKRHCAGFKLLYQGTRDGLNGAAFHQKCDNQGPTVTVALNSTGWVFGGYGHLSWNSAGNYIADPEAFLFKLGAANGRTSLTQYGLSGNYNGYALHGQAGYGPTFGGGHDLTLWTSGAYTIPPGGSIKTNGSCGIGHTYNANGHDANTFCGNDFQLTEVCVYQITDGPGDDAAKERKEENKPWRQNRIQWNDEFRNNLLEKIEGYEPPSTFKYARVLLMGPIGAGKSSFFNTINSIFKGRITNRTPMGSSAHSLTVKFRAFDLKSSRGRAPLGFKICDTMGIEENGGIHMDDVGHLLEGQIPDTYKFNPASSIDKATHGFNLSPTLADEIHCIGLIIDGSSVDVLPEAYLDKFKLVQTHANKRGIPIIALMTKIDKICHEAMEDLSLVFYSPSIQEQVETLADKLGLPKNNVIPVKNYESERDLVTFCDILALDALLQMLNYCDDYIEEHEVYDEEGKMSNLNIKS